MVRITSNYNIGGDSGPSSSGGGSKVKVTSKGDVEAAKKRVAKQKEFLEYIAKLDKRIGELEGNVEHLKKDTGEVKKTLKEEQQESIDFTKSIDALVKQKHMRGSEAQRQVDKLVREAKRAVSPDVVMRRRLKEIAPNQRIADKALKAEAKEEERISRDLDYYDSLGDIVKNLPVNIVPFPSAQPSAGLPKSMTAQLGRRQEGTRKPVGQKMKGAVAKTTESKMQRILRYLTGRGLAKSETATGAPLQNLTEFKKVQNRLAMLEQQQGTIAKIFGMGKNVAGTAASLGSYEGALAALSPLYSRIPLALIAIAAATTVVKAYLAQYRPGGIRDVRKLYRAEDVSVIGIGNENPLFAGENLFISNPAYLQGMPRSRSNTEQLRDSISRYNLRHMGDYS